jgi:hypothetical protein
VKYPTKNEKFTDTALIRTQSPQLILFAKTQLAHNISFIYLTILNLLSCVLRPDVTVF